jgi:hypothetical protein
MTDFASTYEAVTAAGRQRFFEWPTARLAQLRPYLAEPFRLALTVIEQCEAGARTPEELAIRTGFDAPLISGLIAAMRRGGMGLVTELSTQPVFVFGNQKSGTTAIAGLLAMACGLSVTQDLVGEMASPTFDRVITGQLPIDTFVAANWLAFTRDIIKEPNLTLLHAHLARIFPEARRVFVIRDPRDNIRSILDRLNIPGTTAGFAKTSPDRISPAWQLGLDGRWLGLTGDGYIELLAERWNRMADVFLDRRQETILVRYEQFVQDKVNQIIGIAERLAFDTVADIGGAVDYQFQPRGQHRDLPWPVFFGAVNLKAIERICGERMGQFGYQ